MSLLRDVPTAFSRLSRHLIDFIYPPVCQVCHNSFVSTDENIWLCENCRTRMQQLPAPVCPICRNSMPVSDQKCSHCRRQGYLSWQYSLGIYDETLSHLIKACKYSDKPGIAAMLGQMLAEQLSTFPHVAKIELVCAVPMHPRKEAKRGFNQTEIIAESLAAELGKEYVPHLLGQSRRNRDQIGLTVQQRYRNVHGAFAVADPDFVRGRAILVVDDVTTSGATLNAVAHILNDAGAAMVAAATAAMALEEGLSPDQLYAMMWEEF